MALRIRLLGPPGIERDGEAVALTGRKPWGLLTRLTLEPRATRLDLAEHLVPEANDPLAALRWLLHQVRRAVQPDVTIEERDGWLSATLADDVDVDVLRLLGVPDDIDEIEELVRGELLEGMGFDDAPAFELWLALQRTRAHDAIAEALWWAGNRLATKDPDRAIRMTERALVFDPFCETTNELLLDLLVQNDNHPVARERYQVIERRFLDELGVLPSDTVRRPLDRPRAREAAPTSASARALLESAHSRLSAGELDRAVETARRAADIALALGDPELELASLLVLATTLIHANRGRDQEAKGLLSRSLQLATDVGDAASLSDVEREMGWVFAMEPLYGGAEASFVRAIAHADAAGDDARAGKAQTYLGMCFSDRCAFDAAERTLSNAIDRFDRSGELGWQGYARATIGRAVERAGDPERGAAIADRAIDEIRRGGWTAVLPWALLVRAECARVLGDRGVAAEGFTTALTLGTEMADPCWEGLGLRGLGLLERDPRAAARLLEEGLACTLRFSDVYPWARATILADLVELERGRDHRHVNEAFEVASSGPMPDLVERVARYRAQGSSEELVGQTPAQTAAS